MLFRRYALPVAAFSIATLMSACNGAGGAPGAGTDAGEPPSETSPLPDTSKGDPSNPSVTPSYSTDAMIFNGTGVSTSDWQNTEVIVKSMGLSYKIVNSAQLSAMTLDEMSDFGVVIVPGGSGGTIYGNVSAAARIRLRQAVRDRGVGYVGFCAGAWVAVGNEAQTDNTASYGFAVSKGSILSLYKPNGQQPTAAMTPVTFADGSVRQLVWWGGPSTPEWSGGVIARYATGEPAISETYSGKGLVVISGPHPEAPQGWRATAGKDSDGLDYDIAIDMINAALRKQPLAAY